MEQIKAMARIIRDALEEKKGEDVRILDISEVSVLALPVSLSSRS